jgi:signal transduction histidine kinase
MNATDSGRGTYTGSGNDTYSVVYRRIPLLNVSASHAVNNDVALAEVVRNGRMMIVVAAVMGLLAAAALTFFWQDRSRRIERVQKGVEAIARGELDRPIDLRSRDDLRPLVDNLDLVTQQLREKIAREAESQQFNSFVRLSAILTHDLKNAIGALSLTVSNMERHFENAEFRADAMKTLRSATDNLRALVARLSNPITTLSGEHKRPRAIDIVPVLRRVVAASGVESVHSVDFKMPNSLRAVVDVERIDKVVENLIVNANEAIGSNGGQITIEAGTDLEGKPFFSISDTGVGMSQRFIEERLFKPFATTKKRGVGLGLYTCREVVRASGGSIRVESRKDAGTTFTVVLPSPPNDSSTDSSTHQS